MKHPNNWTIFKLRLLDDIYLCSISNNYFSSHFIASIEFFSSDFKTFFKLSSEIYAVVSSEKLHMSASFRKNNKSFR